MNRLKDISFALFIILFSGGCICAFLPLIPIDETRYVSVAWEMWINHSPLVPLLNGQPYSHKPPMLFWLIQLAWYLFGVNGIVPRVVPLSAAMANIALVYGISRELWPKEKGTAIYASIMLSSTLIWTMWSSLIMFDMVLSAWVLTGLLGVIKATRQWKLTTWVLIALGIGGGILTKGPVVLVHILPVSLFVFLWDRDKRKPAGWYAGILTAVLSGIGIALIWAIPAAMAGGKAYGDAIFWGQTAHRMVSSFAHRRPFWWYIPLLPLLFFPWSFFRSSWRGLISVNDCGKRFCLVWFLSALIIFSLISGKQIHYLLPDMPALILLFARGLANPEKQPATLKRLLPMGVAYLLMGATFFLMPVIKFRPDIGAMSVLSIAVLSLGTFALGLYFLVFRFKTAETAARTLALSVVIFIFLVLFSGQGILRTRYDLTDVSKIITRKQAEGLAIGHFGKYYGQYQFLGRLKKPLVVMRNRGEVKGFLKDHANAMIISYTRSKIAPEKDDIYYEQPFRSKNLILWKGRGFIRYLGN